MDFTDFQAQFRTLTGHAPMTWQWRLYRDYFATDQLPSAVDIPTGLGKTAVIALWLLAIREGHRLPRRLVYIVDRRAVVDQATDFVEQMRDRLPPDERMPISTLRGQHADNREWLDNPSAPAIIVGTVDMIGSRLLFEGYGVSRKMRPYHAGLLGADVLIVLDEAHLVPPFERLLASIEAERATFAAKNEAHHTLVPALRLLSLSATGRARHGTTFSLNEADLEEPHLTQPLTVQRLQARKILTIDDCDEKELPQALADRAWELTHSGTKPLRCLIFCDRRDDAEKVHTLLVGNIVRAIKAKEIDTPPPVELFIGARRGHERTMAAAQLESLGFIAGNMVAAATPSFLVATSAGEVGVDLDADHMVCDLVAWERMVQRLGRVNRRGTGDARVTVIDPGSRIPNKLPAHEVEQRERLHKAVRALFAQLPTHADGIDTSPNALREFKRQADEQGLSLIDDATSPAPLWPALTRALIDAWSMTSLPEHTGRPEIAPWLRGWIDDQAQTRVIWRRYLPLRKIKNPTDKALKSWHRDIVEFFEATPPHLSEKLDTETYRVADWITGRATAWLGRQGSGDGSDSLSPDSPVAVTLNTSGEDPKLFTIRDLATTDKKVLNRTLAGKTLILDARFGGCSTQGTLTPDEDGPAWCGDDMEAPGATDDLGNPLIRWQVRQLDQADAPALPTGWRERFRFVAERDDDGDATSALVVYKWRQEAANENDRAIGNEQNLCDHQACAAEKADAIASALGLPAPYAKVLGIAARLHDEGKQAPRWQKAFGVRTQSQPMAKTKGPVNLQLLDGYRHEFGSLPHAQRDAELQALPAEMQDLILHLIAAHHGRARPLISTRGCDDAPPSALSDRAREVALRFARLQRQWGPWGLAWWESLLRAADQQASKDNDRRDTTAPGGNC